MPISEPPVLFAAGEKRRTRTESGSSASEFTEPVVNQSSSRLGGSPSKLVIPVLLRSSLLKDCGMISFIGRNSYIKSAVAKIEKNRGYSLAQYAKALAKAQNLESAQAFTLLDADARDKAIARTENQSLDDATRVFSDHRPIWVKLKLW